MSPGEIHGLHKMIVDDLKRELAEARAEIDRLQRDLDEMDAALICERSFLASREGEPQPRGRTAEQRLRAIRAHLAGVDVAALLDGEVRRASCNATIEQAQWCDNYQDAARARDELAMVDAALRLASPALLAAAREALEP